MRRPDNTALCLTAVLLLSACASPSEPPLADKVLTALGLGSGPAPSTAAPSPPAEEARLVPPDLASTLYFGPDVYQVRAEDQPLLQAHGRWLAEHPQARLLIEAHTDPSGAPDYNAELARMRAFSVKKLLVGFGAKPEQLETAAYGASASGKLKGATPAMSRRVDLKYRLP
jgi:peptidoglycan-associated lipoprotein